MTLSELQAEIGRLLGDPNHDRWPLDVLTIRINLAQTAVQGYTNAIKRVQTLSLTTGVNTPLSLIGGFLTNVIDIIRVDILNDAGDVRKLQGISRDALDYEHPNWQQWENGEPLYYYYDGSNQAIVVAPPPSAEWAGSANVRVYVVQKPADLVESTDVPFDSYTSMIPYHTSIVHWVVAQCWQDDGTPEALAKSRFHRSGLQSNPGEFEREIKRIISKFDSPEDIPMRILWRPEGGRASHGGGVSKRFPLG